ncbi:MAG: hypothetical protein K2O06_18435 [Acetatifactor sp.]|nr:hypothetical protein [Acetatifactor sp.]
MIFKTIDNDSEKWTAKVKAFSKTFDNAASSVTEKLGRMGKAFRSTAAQVKTFLKFGKNQMPKTPLAHIENLYPEREDAYFTSLLDNMAQYNKKVASGTATWQDYFSKLDDSKIWIKEFIQSTDLQKATMEDVKKAYENARASAVDHNKSLKENTLSAKAGKTALKALASAGSMLASWAFAQGIALIEACASASDRLKESARKLGEEFSAAKADLQDYQSKIDAHRHVLLDSSASYEEACNARKELLTIQDEMIKKFGSEAETVQLVTAAVNGQAGALDDLAKKKWQETVNAFNHDPDKKWTEKFGDMWANLWSGSANNLERMVKTMENTKVTFTLLPEICDSTYQMFSRQLQENFGASLSHPAPIHGASSSHFTPSFIDNFTLSGNLNDIYNDLLNIQALAKDLGLEDTFLQTLSRQTQEVKSTLDSYQETYQQYVLYEKILQDENYEASFNAINKSYQEYRDALVSGNRKIIEQARQTYTETAASAVASVQDKSIVDFFNSMYPELQEAVGAWQFEIRFHASVENEDDSFRKDIQNAVSYFKTTDDVLNYSPDPQQEEQITAYNQLTRAADEYGLTLDRLTDKLVEMGLLYSQARHDLTQKLIPGYVPSADVPLAKGLGSTGLPVSLLDAPAAEWIRSLTEKEAVLANSDEFAQALEARKKQLDGAALSAYDYASALQTVKAFQENKGKPDATAYVSESIQQLASRLEPQFSQLQQAYREIFYLDGDGTELLNPQNADLSMLENLRSSFADAAAEAGAAFDPSVLESFFRVLTDGSSSAEQVRQAFNELAGAYLYSTDVLKLLNNDTVDLIQKQLEEMGIQNAGAIVTEALTVKTQQLAAEKEYLAATGKELALAADSEAAAFMAQQAEAGNCGAALALLQLKKLLVNNTLLDSSADISSVLTLAQAAGIAAQSLEKLSHLKAALQYAQESGNTATAEIITKEIKKQQEALQKEVENFQPVKINFGTLPEKASSTGKAAQEARRETQDAARDQKEYADTWLNYMKESLETGRIDFHSFCREVTGSLRRMYQEGQISAKDYFDYSEQMLNAQQSLYDKALSAVSRRLDQEIGRAKEAAEAVRKQNEDLEAQLKEQDSLLSLVDSVYEKQIARTKEQQQVIQEAIDARKEENSQRKRTLELEQAQAALYKAQNQRTNKVFTGTEFIYDTDRNALREARDSLADLEAEQDTARLEQEKAALDSVIEELENYRSLWSEIPDIKKNAETQQLAVSLWGKEYEGLLLSGRLSDLESFREHYISLQEQINSNESLILSYEQKEEYYTLLKEQWASVSDAARQSAENQAAAQLLGADWESSVLDGRLTTLENFKNSYTALQQALADAAWASANEQILAAKEAAKASAGSTGSAGGISGSGNTGGKSGRNTLTGSVPFSALRKKQTDPILEQWTLEQLNLSGIEPVTDYTMPIPKYNLAPVNRDERITVSIGDIHLHDVQKTDSLARDILRELPGKVTQQLEKR